ncbi:MAG: hypothetical protein HYY84_09310 [Deltaproteobacteria bacterium]|nr:hypothetical protein [Deltaproteobacteria bacterium]
MFAKRTSRLSFLVAVATVPLSTAQAGGFTERLGDVWKLAKKVVDVVGDYPTLRATVRTKRAQPCPIDTGFDPAAALTDAGKAALLAKAGAYEDALAARHFVQNIVVSRAEIHPDTKAVQLYPSSIGDASYHSGQLLAARAFRYGVTGKPTDLDLVQNSLIGVYNLLTIASAPSGKITNPRAGDGKMAAVPGLPVRAFVEEGNPLFAGATDLDVKNPDVYRYTGTLKGAPTSRRYLVKANVSRDQINGLLFGIAAAHEVLNPKKELVDVRRDVARAVTTFIRNYVKRGYRLFDLDSRLLMEGPPADLIPTLSWLKTAAIVTNESDIKKAYDKLVKDYFGGSTIEKLFKQAIFKGLQDLVQSLVGDHIELLQMVLRDFNYNLLVLPLYALLRFEKNAETRDVYKHYLKHTIKPLVGNLRIPFFDAVYLLGTGEKDNARVRRAAGVLRQFRNPPFPFGNPAPGATTPVTDFSTRKDLRDPLFDHLSEVWETHLKKDFPGENNPIRYGGGIWPLGPGLAPRDNNIERANPYRVTGEKASGSMTVDGKKTLLEYPGEDYLLNYWIARYHKFL